MLRWILFISGKISLIQRHNRKSKIPLNLQKFTFPKSNVFFIVFFMTSFCCKCLDFKNSGSISNCLSKANQMKQTDGNSFRKIFAKTSVKRVSIIEPKYELRTTAETLAVRRWSSGSISDTGNVCDNFLTNPIYAYKSPFKKKKRPWL